MYYKTVRMLRALGKFGVVGAGVAVSIGVGGTLVAVNAAEKQDKSPSSSTNETVRRRFQFPDSSYPPFNAWNFNWDGLEPGIGGTVWPSKPSQSKDKEDADDEGFCDDTSASVTPAEKVPTARRHLILVRHGQYDQSSDDDSKRVLTSLGEEQAAFAGKKLESMGIKFTSITSSAMTRARQTACIILKNMCSQSQLKLKTFDPLLNEGAPCVPEPPYKNVELWNPSQRDILIEGSRIEAGFRKYFHRADCSQEEDSWEIIVCHGNVIRYCTMRALQFPPEGWLRSSIDHCSITHFIILPTGEVILRRFGDSGHIPHNKATFA